jgi:hypothetical protein
MPKAVSHVWRVVRPQMFLWHSNSLPYIRKNEVGGNRFSWHCEECDAHICNRCLQETQNSWACKGSKSRIEDVGDEINLGGMWTMFFIADDSRQQFCAHYFHAYFRILHQASLALIYWELYWTQLPWFQV